MFYQGDLQEGIGLAVREAKAVVCFVRDDTEESDTWENTYFDGEVPDLLQQHAVTLRLVAGSPEVGHLNSICPIIAYPTVMVIKNGLVQLYVFRGTTKEQFQTRLKATLTASQPSPAPAPAPAPPTTQAPVQTPAQPAQAPSPPSATTTTTTTPPSVSSPSPSTSSTTQQERANSEDSQRRRDSIRAGKRPVTSTARTDSERASQEQKQLREEQLRLEREKRQQREERERIRSNIQKDQERRRLEAQEAARLASSSSTTTSPGKLRASNDQYRLQVRLFDGQSVRSSFPPSATVSKDVRTWLDSQQPGTKPYKLKHVLTPQPSRTLSVADEERTLQELELGPTASLVMVPVHNYSDAYSASSSSSTASSAWALAKGLPARIVSVFVGLIVTLFELIKSLFALGGNSAAPSSRPPRTDAGPASGTSSASSYARNGAAGGRGNIRTLRDQRRDDREDQLYNGNQLNFEPRRDDADGKDRKEE
ncbi:hypothetical protein VTN49DRAFT_1680 [Thermomyces lanuginosus]|uniref:uncharacterized protein n=1 Tax=Thermomyces lanuginosus TaxID=5541 RepID=UPI0037420A09